MNGSALESPPVRVRLDVRDLRPPAPLQFALNALALLPPQAALLVRTGFEPVLLYQMIDADDWLRSSRQLEPGDWEIRIWRAEEAG